jgi:REP element-mobilizing transposase RayT
MYQKILFYHKLGSDLQNLSYLNKFSNFAIILGLKRPILLEMARKIRIEFPGALYHVLARGNNKQQIFNDDQDYKAYLKRIERYRIRYKFTLYAFVLMPNHVHFLMEIGFMSLSKIMQGLQQSYTSYFHKKYKTVGHLFQGRYKAILCQRDAYLLELVRYIHLNPVRAAIVANPEDYLWSSHQFYLGYLGQPFIEKDFIFTMLSENESTAERIYRQFIKEGIDKGHQDALHSVIDQRFLGSPEYVREAKQKAESKDQNRQLKREQAIQNSFNAKKKALPEILKVVSEITAISHDSILGKSRERCISDGRCLFAFIAARHAGISNKSIADFLKRDASSITRMIHKIDDIINNDQILSSNADKIIQVLQV